MTTKLTLANFDPAVASALNPFAITTVYITDSSYTNLDDTAISTSGGYVKFIGTGFTAGCTAYVNGVAATSTTYVSATEVRAQLGALAVGTYSLMLFGSNYVGAIYASGITYSGFPSITTSAYVNLGNVVNTQLVGTGDGTLVYSLQGGSSLPAGVTLSSTGLISGTASTITVNTVLNFTVLVDDAQKQTAQQAITLSLAFGDVNFPNTVLLLQADSAANGANNNTFLDSSSNNLTVTRAGTPTQGTFTPFSPTGWSNYFNGTTDYLSISHNAALDLTSGDFTIECWAFITSVANNVYLINKSGVSGTKVGAYTIQYRTADSTWSFTTSNSTGSTTGTFYTFGSGSNVLNTWLCFTVTRLGTTINTYLNGSLITSVTQGTTIVDGAQSFTIGSQVSGGSLFAGYVSNLRVIKGTAAYTSAFTPSILPLTAVTNTALLTCQSNRFIDNSTNAFAITTTGTPSVQAYTFATPAALYSPALHGGSTYFNGTTDYLSIPDNASLQFTGAFTIEAWVYYVTIPTTQQVWVARGGASGIGTWSLGTVGSGSSVTRFYYDAAGTGVTFNTSLNINTWYHIALVRDSGNTLSCFINGIKEATTATVTTSFNVSTTVLLGVSRNAGAPWFNGYLSNVRLIKDIAQYTVSFTPPTAPVTSITNTSLLMNFTNASIRDSASKNDIITVGSAQVNTSVVKYGTGSMMFNGTTDYLTIPKSTLFDFGSGNFTVELWYYITSTAAWAPLLSKGPTDADDEFFLTILTGGAYYFDYGNATTEYIQGGTAITNAWTHLALVRNGTNIAIYANGTLAVSGTLSRALTNNYNMYVGMGRNGSYYMNGYIDDLRITKGLARYTANFTPPTIALGQ